MFGKKKNNKGAAAAQGTTPGGGGGPQVDQELVPIGQAPPQMSLLPNNPAPQQNKKKGGIVSNLMGGIVGAGQGDDDDGGMLDHPQPAGQNNAGGGRGGNNGNDGARPSDTGSQRKPASANQDLWLLNFFFKGCALLVYFFLPIVFPDTLAYILVLMLSSIDFWVVKNIVGRKLIKMRWWFIIDNEGNERWHFESRDVQILFQDKLVFWGSIYLTPLVWLLFCVMNAITFAIFKTATTMICCLIGAVQYWGFKNCKAAHERKMRILARRKGKGFFPGKKKSVNNPDLQQNLLPQGQSNNNGRYNR